VNGHVLVTGASGGIGSAVCRRFLAGGWKVTGLDLADPPAEASWTHVRCDLAAAGAARDAANAASATEPVSAVVHAAAVQEMAAAGEADAAAWARTLQVNVVALDEIVGACASDLRTARGSVTALSSVHAYATTRRMAPYATSKAALVGWVRAAALDLAPDVRVNALAPGAVRTRMLEEGFARRPDAGDPLAELAGKTPLGVVAEPASVAEMVWVLADPHVSGYLTGSTIVLDGGALLRLGTE
jgi:NAD(P)-dependent dehydrogenase (short-subunit alcohol dehydrogenase family)